MTRLVEALHALGLVGEASLGDRWLRIRGQQCWVYIAEATWGRGYYTWCEDVEGRVVEFYLDPTEAIQAGLRRAAQA